MSEIKHAIETGKTYLGIEMGSTRIKAVLIDETFKTIASGGHEWENRLENGIWSYRLEDAVAGLQASYKALCDDVKSKYGTAITKLGGIGISAMMHGYLPFDKDGNLLTPFRTWRNTITEQAAKELTDTFGFNIPQRWGVAHVYQATINKESHVGDIALLTTLAGYVHLRLTGKNCLGANDASGMFPLDSQTISYNSKMADRFDQLIAQKGYGWKIRDILPPALPAGENAGYLTAEGAKLLDPTGVLQPGTPMCPPEGDAGTGMVATNSVEKRTGNISAGTSIFAMIVLEKELISVHPEIDMITTPAGKPVAMAHCNNCTSDLDAWVRLFSEQNELMGIKINKAELYDKLYFKALEGDPDCGGLLSYNYFSGEHVTRFEQGRPLFTRLPDSRFNLANFMRTHINSTMATLRIGMDILRNEDVHLDRMLGHGGLFKTELVGQKLMAAALNVPVTVMDSAAEGGAWGIALLAAFCAVKSQGETLEAFLSQKVFSAASGTSVEPDPKDVEGFNAYMERYRNGLAIEKAAVENLA